MGFVGRVLVGGGGCQSDWGEQKKGGMGPALDGLTINWVGSSERVQQRRLGRSRSVPPAGQETVSLETFTSSSFPFLSPPPLSFPPPSLSPQSSCQCSRAFSDTAAAQCFPCYSDAVARPLTRSRQNDVSLQKLHTPGYMWLVCLRSLSQPQVGQPA